MLDFKAEPVPRLIF